MDSLYQAVLAASNAVWGPWTVFLLLGTGLVLTLRFRFVQLTRLRQAAAGLVPKAQAGAKGVLSPFQAFMTGLILLGATTSVEMVWAWGDLMNGLQIFHNLVG